MINYYTRQMFDMDNNELEIIKKQQDRKQRAIERSNDILTNEEYMDRMQDVRTIYKQACRIQQYNMTHPHGSSIKANPVLLKEIEKGIDDLKYLIDTTDEDRKMLAELKSISVKINKKLRRK